MSWTDIGGNASKGRIKQWFNFKSKTIVFILKSKFGKYAVYKNKTHVNDRWFDNIFNSIKYAKNIMKVN